MLKNMKNKLLLAAILSIAGFSFSASSLADEDNSGPFFGKEAPGKWIIGAKIGQIDTNIDNIQDADVLGIVAGYEFARPVGGSGSSTFEMEYMSSNEAAIDGFAAYKADVLNLFFTYRSAGDLYFKVKGGLSYSEIDINSVLLPPTEDLEDTSLAAGIGIGYRIFDLGVVELEYSQDSGESDLGIFGLNGLLEF